MVAEAGLLDVRNRGYVLTSSRQSEVTFLAVTHAQPGTQVDGTIRWDESKGVQGKPDQPGDPPPFTSGATKAVDDWSENPANQNGELGQALSTRGRTGTATALARWDGSTGRRTIEPTPGRRGPGARSSRNRPASRPVRLATR